MPKVSGTRKERAKLLHDRIVRGPAINGLPPVRGISESDWAILQADFLRQYRIWSESWIIPELDALVPELKGKIK